MSLSKESKCRYSNNYLHFFKRAVSLSQEFAVRPPGANVLKLFTAVSYDFSQ